MQDGGELSTPAPPRAPTVDEGPVQPLDVVVVGEGEQHLVADDGEGEQQHSAQRHGQGEGAQPQPARDPTWVSELEVPPPGDRRTWCPSAKEGKRDGRNSRNPVDSSVLIIVHCRGQETSEQEKLPAIPCSDASPSPSLCCKQRCRTQKSFGWRWGLCSPPPHSRTPHKEQSCTGIGAEKSRSSPRALAQRILPPAAKSVCFLKCLMTKWQRM